jgi:hypothetical protein
MVSIRKRPVSIEDRAVPGHWEGDLLSGSKNSYTATLVERHTRYVMLLKVANNNTRTVVSALIKQAKTLLTELYKSLTWDRGKELTDHRRFSLATDIDVYFCGPRSPWQRGSNENTNGLLRQYFPKGNDLSVYFQAHLNKVACQLRELEARIVMLEGEIKTWFRGNELAKRLETIPEIGFITASALAASVTDPHRFTSARQLAASLGLTPKADSSGGRERMGRISKMGDRYLRRLLVSGMTSQLQSARCKPEAHPWVASLLAKKPNKLVAVAMANKAVRISWVAISSSSKHTSPVTFLAINFLGLR